MNTNVQPLIPSVPAMIRPETRPWMKLFGIL